LPGQQVQPLLTQGPLPLLQRSAPARIINVASQYASDLDLDDLQFDRRQFESGKAYAQSKACDRMLTWALARRLTQYSGGRTSEQGADTAVWLASDPELETVSGKFFEDREELECEFRNKRNEEKLWKICEELVNKNNP